MSGVSGGAYFLGAWAALTAGLFVAGEDYSRATFAIALVVLWMVLGQKLRKGEATVKTLVQVFLALGAVYLLNAVDFALDAQYLFSAFNAMAFVVTIGAALWVNKR